MSNTCRSEVEVGLTETLWKALNRSESLSPTPFCPPPLAAAVASAPEDR